LKALDTGKDSQPPLNPNSKPFELPQPAAPETEPADDKLEQ